MKKFLNIKRYGFLDRLIRYPSSWVHGVSYMYVACGIITLPFVISMPIVQQLVWGWFPIGAVVLRKIGQRHDRDEKLYLEHQVQKLLGNGQAPEEPRMLGAYQAG